MEPLISVIIPVYNVEPFLCECVDSVLAQTYTNLEIILVDDGSTDNSGRICDAYGKKDSRVMVIHKKNQGISAARNTGMKNSHGDYFCFVDSDDYIAENLIETVIDVFSRESVQIVGFDIILTDEQGRPTGAIESDHGLLTDKEATLRHLLTDRLTNYAWNKIYARQVFEGISFPEGYSWEDMGTIYKLLLKAEAVYCIPEKLYFYRQRSASIIHNITEKALRDIFVMQKRRYDDLQGMFPDVAELALPLVANSALCLYDRSLWAAVDQTVLTEARDFLTQKKDRLISLPGNRMLRLYYWNERLYSRFRILRHKFGNVVKSVYVLMN